MNNCAVNFDGCKQTTPNGRRGICSKCYKQLLEEGLIVEGEPFPDWLLELIRIQRNFDDLDKESVYIPDFEEMFSGYII